MTETEYDKMSESQKKKEDWMNNKWRPVMGWSYMLTCIMDFVIFPILWSLLQSISHGSVSTQWNPITLQGAGFYHVAMGAILGITAYGRTQEKISGMNNSTRGFQRPRPEEENHYVPDYVTNRYAPEPVPTRNWDSQPRVLTGYRGKPMPVQPDHPEI